MHPDLIHNYVSHHFVFAISCHQDYKQALQSKKSMLKSISLLGDLKFEEPRPIQIIWAVKKTSAD